MVYRIRAESPTGDYTFGQSGANFLVDSPAAVRLRIQNRLNLWEGDWYLDLSDGVPNFQQILGFKNIALAEALIRQRILGTPFVRSITNLSVVWNNATRSFDLSGLVVTAFGEVTFDFPITPLLAGDFTIGTDPFGGGGEGLGD